MASALSALAGAMRGKFSNRQGHSKGAFPLTSKRGPRDFYKGKGAKSTGRLTKKGACAWGVAVARAGGRPGGGDVCRRVAWRGPLFAELSSPLSAPARRALLHQGLAGRHAPVRAQSRKR